MLLLPLLLTIYNDNEVTNIFCDIKNDTTYCDGIPCINIILTYKDKNTSWTINNIDWSRIETIVPCHFVSRSSNILHYGHANRLDHTEYFTELKLLQFLSIVLFLILLTLF